jgi:hypothetical protein
LVVAAFAALLGVVVAVPLLQRRGPATTTAPAASPFREITLAQLEKPTALGLSVSPAGGQAFMADGEGLATLPTTPLREGSGRPSGLLSWASLGIASPIAARVSDDGQFVLVTGPGGDIVPADIVDVTSRAVVAHVTSACREIALSRDGRLAVTHDGWPALTLRAWDLAAGTSREGPKVATGSYDVSPPKVTLDVSSRAGVVLSCVFGTTSVWDLATGVTRTCPERLFFARLVGDSGRVVGFPSGPGTGFELMRVAEWDPAKGTVRVVWSGYERLDVQRAWVSPSGRLLVANVGAGLMLWSLEKAGPPLSFEFPAPHLVIIGDPVPALAFTPDERSLLVALAEGRLLWLDLDR